LLEPGRFPQEPIYVDLTKFVERGAFDLSDPGLRDQVVTVAAPIHGRPKAELESQDKAELRRFRRYRRAAVGALTLLTALAVVTAALAFFQRNEATRQRDAARAERDNAFSKELAANAATAYAERRIDRGLLLATHALATKDTLEARGALMRGVAEQPWLTAYVEELGPSRGRLALNRSGTVIAGTIWDGLEVDCCERVALWDTDGWRVTPRSDQIVRTEYQSYSATVAFSADQTLLTASWSNDELTLTTHDLVTGVDEYPSRVLQIGKPIVVAALSPSAQTLFVLADDDTVTLLDVLSSGNPRVDRWWPMGLRLNHFLTPVVALSDTNLLVATDHGDVTLWDVAGAAPTGVSMRYEPASVASVAITADGGRVAVGLSDGSIQLRNSDGSRVGVVRGHRDPVVALAFDGSGQGLVSASSKLDKNSDGSPLTENGTVIQWRIGNSAGLDSRVDGLAGYEEMLPEADAEPHLDYSRLDSGCCTAVVSPNGKTRAEVGDEGVVTVTGADERLGQLHVGNAGGPPGQMALAFRSDGMLLAAAGGEGRIVIWDVTTRRERTLADLDRPVWSLALSPDNRWLAAGSEDGLIRLFDISAGQMVGPGFDPYHLQNDDELPPVVALRFTSPDHLLSRDIDGGLYRWDLSTDALVSFACGRAHRNLNRDEWTQFLGPDRPYSKACSMFPAG
jgi:WD40 repeat protein